MSDMDPGALLEDEDGAPYPEQVQEIVRSLAAVRAVMAEYDKAHEDTCQVYFGDPCDCIYGDVRVAAGLERQGW